MSTESAHPVFILYDTTGDADFYVVEHSYMSKHFSLLERLADNPDDAAASFRIFDLLNGVEDLIEAQEKDLERLEKDPEAPPKKIQALKRVIKMLHKRQDEHERFWDACIEYGKQYDLVKLGACSSLYFFESPELAGMERPDLEQELGEDA